MTKKRDFVFNILLMMKDNIMEQLLNENLNILITHDKFGLKQVHGFYKQKNGRKKLE